MSLFLVDQVILRHGLESVISMGVGKALVWSLLGPGFRMAVARIYASAAQRGASVACFKEARATHQCGDLVLVGGDNARADEGSRALLATYRRLRRVGDLFLVEDSICHEGLGVGPSPGTFESVAAFVA